jgi:hypothetical protein
MISGLTARHRTCFQGVNAARVFKLGANGGRHPASTDLGPAD